jgi:pimeloyl-ACP methyl ester carboxylesterase
MSPSIPDPNWYRTMKTKSIKRFSLSGLALLGLAAALYSAPTTKSETGKTMSNAKTTIVLVHGAFADANSWSKVIPALEKDGYNVVAVQNPLVSYANDVETTRRVIDAQKGAVIVVGHSYGGAVISKAALGASNVKALVFVAAIAPDEGEVFGPLLAKYPSKIGAALRPDAAGFLYIDRSLFKEAFAADVTDTERIVMETTQKPIKDEIFGTKFGVPAWKTLPTWYLVATEDNAINPDLERMFAKRMNAKTTEVKASHVPFISKPDAVVKIIKEAATSVGG